jgi:HK97 family phage prohead protease
LEEQRAETVAELDSLDIDFDQLIMKRDADMDSDTYKGEAAAQLLEVYNVMVAVENDEGARANYSDLGITAIAPADVPDVEGSRAETRQVDLTPPAYMRASARRGLQWHEDGLSGDGLRPETVREARALANGSVTADKWVRLRAFLARHLVDFDAPAAKPDHPNFPSPGVVAIALWGGGTTRRSAERAMDYASGVIARIEAENEGRAKGQALSKMETRVYVTDFEVREESDGMHLTGYAARFNEPSEPLPFIERIAPGAFSRSLRSRNDIKLLWNHDSSMVLGSTRSGTLKLIEDDRGLRVSAILPDTQAGRDAKVLIQRGDVTGFSFGFTVPSGGEEWNAEGTERTLKAVRLLEVSTGVPFPAYPSTNGTAVVRGLDKVAQRAEVDADALADALLKIENGEDISADDRQLLNTVITKLSPAEEAQEITDDKGLEMLALKKKKLELLMGL